jgi:hypothetical protein
VGSDTIIATYASDFVFAASSGSTVQTVQTFGTTTTVGSSPNPSVFSQSVTFTAAVTSSGGVPAGMVTFKDGSSTLGTSALDGTAHATFATSTLAVASHSITATYNGGSGFAPSTSSAFTQVVNQDGTTSTVSSSRNPSKHGQKVTFTATVAASSPGTATATGSVTFKDGTTTLSTQTLNSSGNATFSTSSLSRGSHSITVVYGGSSSFLGSTSPVLTQTVK